MKKIKKNTQVGRLLTLLKNKGAEGVTIDEIQNPAHFGGLAIPQYNARIKDLRKLGYDIKSEHPRFILVGRPEEDREYTYKVNKETNMAEIVYL